MKLRMRKFPTLRDRDAQQELYDALTPQKKEVYDRAVQSIVNPLARTYIDAHMLCYGIDTVTGQHIKCIDPEHKDTE